MRTNRLKPLIHSQMMISLLLLIVIEIEEGNVPIVTSETLLQDAGGLEMNGNGLTKMSNNLKSL